MPNEVKSDERRSFKGCSGYCDVIFQHPSRTDRDRIAAGTRDVGNWFFLPRISAPGAWRKSPLFCEFCLPTNAPISPSNHSSNWSSPSENKRKFADKRWRCYDGSSLVPWPMSCPEKALWIIECAFAVGEVGSLQRERNIVRPSERFGEFPQGRAAEGMFEWKCLKKRMVFVPRLVNIEQKTYSRKYKLQMSSWPLFSLMWFWTELPMTASVCYRTLNFSCNTWTKPARGGTVKLYE